MTQLKTIGIGRSARVIDTDSPNYVAGFRDGQRKAAKEARRNGFFDGAMFGALCTMLGLLAVLAVVGNR